jgi:hypothetical protein
VSYLSDQIFANSFRSQDFGTWFQTSPSRVIFSHALHVVERFKPMDANIIQYEVTITDPVVYTRPLTIAMPLKRMNSELMEAACHEEESGK